MSAKSEISNVLFADIKSFSKLDTEHGTLFHETVLQPLAKQISAYDVDHLKMWGDAFVMTSANVRDLCLAGLDLRDFFLNHDWYRSGLPPLELRVSLHQGRYLSGEDPFTKEGWIFGPTINLAARIEPITQPGSIWVTGEIASAVEREKEFPGACDFLGNRTLAKGSGTERIYVLRRRTEQELTETDRIAQQRIHDETEANKGIPYEIAISVVCKDGKIVLVKPREGPKKGCWQFPAGAIKPNGEPKSVAWREVKNETNLVCSVVEEIGSRIHPSEGIRCHYFLLEVLSGEIENLDSNENEEVMWVNCDRVHELIGNDVFDKALEAIHNHMIQKRPEFANGNQ